MADDSKEVAETKAPAAATKPLSADTHDADQLRLQQMGHEQELKRHFTVWSLIGLASTTTISWTGLGLGLITEINAGGPGAVIYGFILVWMLQCFLGASLAEFVSAYPTEGGMYHWVAAIAPRKHSGFLSFITGWWSVSGWIFTTASTNLVYAQNFMALIALYRSDLVIKAWMTFVVYQITNLATASIVLFGNKIIPAMNKFSLFYLQLAWFVLMVTVAATAPRHNDAKFVFRTWINNTGWENNVICFITGLVNPLYSLGGLDGITHITEEMPNPSRNAPLALLCTLTIAFITGLTYLITLMFSVQDYAALGDTSTGLPLAELFRQATSSTGGAFALIFLLWIALGPCMVGSQLSTSRVVWAFARDNGLPQSQILSKVSARFKVPFNAQLLVTAVCAALGCLYLGSSTAFNAMLGSAVTINNIAYLIPILTNVLQGRRVLVRGKFHMGTWKGMAVNLVTVAWLVFAIVFFSFPYVQPVQAANMNYTCVCVGGIGFIALGWWFVAGERFTAQMVKAKEDEVAREAAEAVLRGQVAGAKGEESSG
ncbi:Amino acid/polyamine transporter I [Neofusicoccum parvum]|nr:Amino acid/polyamine transporter I [Neofusicoccum parvum]